MTNQVYLELEKMRLTTELKKLEQENAILGQKIKQFTYDAAVLAYMLLEEEATDE